MRRSTILGALATLLAVVLLPTGAAAQYGANQKYFGAHVGVSGVGSAAAVGVNGEVAYNEHIGIGGWADTWSYGQTFNSTFGNSSYNVRYVALAGTGAYHFAVKSAPKFDPFVGVALGYYIVSSKAESSFGGTASADASRIFLGGYGGARYFFKNNLSGVARLGVGASYLSLGVDFRM